MEAPKVTPHPTELGIHYEKWLDTLTAEERLQEIAAICVDWDGFRTADGLGQLINEIWALCLYPVKKGKKNE